MADLAPIASRIPVPGRSLWWIAGAGAIGVLLPTMTAAATALLSYYPISAVLGIGIRLTGTFVAILGVGMLTMFVGIGYSLLAKSWRPFLLSIIVLGGMILGFYPGITAHSLLRNEAFDLLADRSVDLVQAIERYQRDAGAPPPSLDVLVPQYLPQIPHTGMAAYPDYEYELGSGMCPDDNSWNINILAGDVLNWDTFFYCPRKNYPPDGGGNWVEVIGEWAYMHE